MVLWETFAFPLWEIWEKSLFKSVFPEQAASWVLFQDKKRDAILLSRSIPPGSCSVVARLGAF